MRAFLFKSQRSRFSMVGMRKLQSNSEWLWRSAVSIKHKPQSWNSNRRVIIHQRYEWVHSTNCTITQIVLSNIRNVVDSKMHKNDRSCNNKLHSSLYLTIEKQYMGNPVRNLGYEQRSDADRRRNRHIISQSTYRPMHGHVRRAVKIHCNKMDTCVHHQALLNVTIHIQHKAQ